MSQAIPLQAQIDCVERELRQRARVYPRLIAQKKMSQGFADVETARMQAVLKTLRGLLPGEQGRLL